MAVSRFEIESAGDPLGRIEKWYPHHASKARYSRGDVLRFGKGAEVVSQTLDNIVRFGNGLKRMEHPTTVLTHSIRTEAIALGLVRICDQIPDCPPLDPVKVVEMARAHDIEEARTGDITKDVKERMTPHEKARHDERVKREVVDMAVVEYGLQKGSPEWIRFIATVNEILAKTTLESQVVKIADLLDAVGEIMHELRSGNERFGEILEEYKGTLSLARGRYPLWNAIEKHRAIRLSVMPQPEALRSLPRLMPLDFANLGEGPERYENFKKIMLQGEMPRFYKTWLQATLFRFGPQASQVLFPRWNLAPLA